MFGNDNIKNSFLDYSNKMNEKQKILNLALETFLSEGFYKTTMDDLAAKLRISKKTIYKNFSTKEDLLKEVTQFFLKTNHDAVVDSVKSQSNAVDQLFGITKTIGAIVTRVSDKMISDLHNYAPELWKEIDEFRTKMMIKGFTKIIKQGKKEGYIRNINTDIMITSFISSLRGVANPEFVISNKITISEALETTISIFLNGILTEKGKKNFSKLKNNGANK